MEGLQHFLTPTACAYQKVPPRSEVPDYLQKNHNNILAEFWMMVESPSAVTFEVTTARMVDEQAAVSFTGITSVVRHQRTPPYGTVAAAGKEKEKEPELSEFHNHFGVLNGRYCLLVNTRARDLRIFEGANCPKDHERSIDYEAQDEMRNARPKRIAFFDYGFIGDSINELRACTELREDYSSYCDFDILESVADPSKRGDAAFVRASAESLRRPGISPANAGQANAIQSLQRSVEGIQGPPGTGKSTVIAHILRSSTPEDEVSLVTCVQNKAVDAIAEKLRSIEKGVLPFFVVGNTERLGLIAQQWTIERQVERDPRVVALNRSLTHYQQREKVQQNFFTRKFALLSDKYLNARRSLLADSKFKKRDGSELTPDEQDARQKWILADHWERVWKAYLSNKYDFKINYLKTLRRKISKLDNQLALMKVFVKAEIISTARAILATTATASGSLAKNDELAPAFLKLRTIIIDEAGTVPETKMPLLISLNPAGLRRIVAIGDQNQLAPFTRLSNAPSGGRGGGRGQGENVCWAFASRGRCDRGDSCRYNHVRGAATSSASGGDTGPPISFFQRVEQALPRNSIPTLTEQFRMHPVVCSFVAATFYDGALTTNPLIGRSRVRADPVGLWWLAYHDKNAESSPPRSTSKVNETEAILALGLLDREDLRGKSVMVITFYKAQETLLKKMLGTMGRGESEALRILSVDQSQGSEADVVILSCVRSNDSRSIGFVKNANRMNVAVSRMRYQLIVIGCRETLGTDSKWASLYAHATKYKSGGGDMPLLPPGQL
jgi:hypothetical protein